MQTVFGTCVLWLTEVHCSFRLCSDEMLNRLEKILDAVANKRLS